MASHSVTPAKCISLVSYNMHGFSQGICLLDSLCSNGTDVIMIQETWMNYAQFLHACNVYNSNYMLFCSSAMNEVLAAGVLRVGHLRVRDSIA